MKKLITLIILSMSFVVFNCNTVSTTQLGGKQVIRVSRVPRTVFFGINSATAEDCLADLNKAGANNIEDIRSVGGPAKSIFKPSISSLTDFQACYALGTK